jgi:PIN domain nuclease of toxin-antitoxin system
VNIIIDTHIFLWALSNPSRISKPHLAALETPSNTIWLSSVSVAEIMIKASIGKLTVDFDVKAVAEKSGFELLDYSASDALMLKELPFHHKDPFDRMLISQSRSRGYRIMTEDGKFQSYECVLVS